MYRTNINILYKRIQTYINHIDGISHKPETGTARIHRHLLNGLGANVDAADGIPRCRSAAKELRIATMKRSRP